MTPPTSIWTGAVYRVGVAGHGTPDILLVKLPFCACTGDGDELVLGEARRRPVSGKETLSSSLTLESFMMFEVRVTNFCL